MWDLAEVGTVAPALFLRDDDEPQPRRPRLLAFVTAWSIDAEDVDLPAVQQRLAALDAELVVVCGDGAWSFVRDGAPRFCDRLAADVATAAAVYGVTGDAVFVIDHRGVIRFAHRPDRPLSATLTEALDAAAEALCWRQHHTPLQRVQWSPREWALKCLVVGCALTFLGAAEPRLARGTGPVRACVSRVAITPSAAIGAPASQLVAHEPERTALSPDARTRSSS